MMYMMMFGLISGRPKKITFFVSVFILLLALMIKHVIYDDICLRNNIKYIHNILISTTS